MIMRPVSTRRRAATTDEGHSLDVLLHHGIAINTVRSLIRDRGVSAHLPPLTNRTAYALQKLPRKNVVRCIKNLLALPTSDKIDIYRTCRREQAQPDTATIAFPALQQVEFDHLHNARPSREKLSLPSTSLPRDAVGRFWAGRA